MKRFGKCSLAGGALLVGLSLASAQSPSTIDARPSPKLTVQVYSYAAFSRAELVHAERVCAGIFEASGIEFEWRDCPTSSSKDPADAPCRQFLGPDEIVMRLLARRPHARGKTSADAFGYASGRNYASVFSNRIRDLAEGADRNAWEIPSILGSVMAHEIGHLLLGADSHTPTGIMRAEWNRRMVQKVLCNRARFSPAQAQAMHLEALKRLKNKSAGEESAQGNRRTGRHDGNH